MKSAWAMMASRFFLENHAGGILGGISTASPSWPRFAVKPTSSILTPRATIDRYGNETEIRTKGRHDPCVGIRAVPVGEAMLAIVLADHYLRASRAGRLNLPPAQHRRGFRMPDITARVLAAIEAFKRGEIVVVTDDDDREGEGDLIVAASLCTAEKMAFIVPHTSGIVCAPLPIAEARRLRLDPMVAVNDSAHTTAFTVSIDYREGLTTGISADERTATVRALTNGNVQAGDFVRPGHIFPLIARDGGVLMRSGHTEAAGRSLPARGAPAGGRDLRTRER